MKRILLLITLILACGAVISCGVTGPAGVSGRRVTVGVCKNGSSKTTIKYYKRCIRDAGAKPYFFPYYATTDEKAAEFVSSVDALIVPGKTGSDTTGRSKYDYKVIRAALAQGKPILGICLGHQEINGVYKGSIGLIPKYYPESGIKHMDKVDGKNVGLNSEAHAINIDTTSRLYRILGEERVMVNTSHNFSITEVGEGLKVVATGDDGVIEAIEDNSRNVMGVQFHPEYLYGKFKIKRFRAIFKNLVEEAKTVKREKRNHAL